jgi:hypothetical protein
MTDIDLIGICNNNINNMPANDTYTAFNDFIFSTDIKLIGKLLFRYRFFDKTYDLPGDIVELGVFKGSGIATWIKFLQIFDANSNKKVIGFDLFDSMNTVVDSYENKDAMKVVYSKVDPTDLTVDNVDAKLSNINQDKSKYILVKGDVCITTRSFIDENPGFRISLIYVDLDLGEPVYASLMNLWDRLLPGGYIIFDEYEYHKFDESTGVDKFLKDKNIEYNVISTHWIAPTSYMIKKQSMK